MEAISITIERLIAAPADFLFDAWTRAEHLIEWWGPGPVTCPEAEIDLRIGGEYRIANRMEDGRTLWITGEFLEIDRPNRLVYSWLVMDQDMPSHVTVTFTETDSGTLVRIVHDRLANRDLAEMHERGWMGCLEGLAGYAPTATG